MTVSQLHNYMTEKVVPESVMPQNIAACLIDDNAQIPELDAFTFLNRVRALGIGSADFLYLLKGCNAPEEAVEKIENNPAMNLQTLVVTLESAGLTPKDYTRMLYTARQLWERTLTMQLDEIDPAELPTVDDIVPSSENTISKEYDDNKITSADNDAEDEFFGDEDLPENEDIEDIVEEYDEQYDNIEDDHYSSDDDYEYEIDPDDHRPEIDFGNHNREEEAKTNTGKIVAASIGAVILLGLSATMNYMGFKKSDITKPAAHFAESYQELFTEIHTAYNNGNIIKEITPRSFDNSEAFGDLLIEKPSDGLGVYSVGKSAFSAESDQMTLYQSLDGTLVTKGIIPAPENAEFIEIINNTDSICAVFKGEYSSGFVVYNENGELLYSCNQLGVLTDISVNDETLSLGTVYVPSFTESFTVQQTEKFTPTIQLDDNNILLPASSIITNGYANGCGYAVFAEYSLSDGSMINSFAALGDPVFSGAEEFTAVMRTADGFELITLSEPVETEEGKEIPIKTQHISNALHFDDGAVLATAEKTEDGTINVYLRGDDLTPVAAITNLPEELSSLKIKDDILYIYGDQKVIMALDISDPSAPAVIELNSAIGVVDGDYALCGSATSSLIKLTLYKKTENGISEAGSYTKALSLTDNEIPEFAGANSFYIGGEDRCAVAYSYFDGVSVISEFGIFGKAKTAYTLFDDKTGFSEAANINGELHLICGSKSITVK